MRRAVLVHDARETIEQQVKDAGCHVVLAIRLTQPLCKNLNDMLPPRLRGVRRKHLEDILVSLAKTFKSQFPSNSS